MKKVFDKIKAKATDVRYVTQARAITTPEDIRVAFESILEVLDDIDKRLEQLENQ